MNLSYKEIQTPVGKLKLITNTEALVAILWEKEKAGRVPLNDALEKEENHPLLQRTEKQLVEYFNAQRSSFDIPLELMGSDFQRAVWSALRNIPYGTTCSYSALAQKMGRPSAVRAVSSAVGKNPLSILLPCHRVIGVDGSLRGFAGGLEEKKWLLQLELSFFSS